MSLIVTDLNGNTEMLTDYKELKRKRRVNGEHSLSFILFSTQKNTHSFPLVQEESKIECDGEEYRIKKVEVVSKGEKSAKTVHAEHVFFDLIDEFQYDTTSGELTISEALSFVTNGTDFTFEVIDSFPTRNFGELGNGNALSLIKQVLDKFGAEVKLNNKNIKVYQQIGQSSDFQFRYKHNLKTISKHTDTSNLSTYIKGYGKQNDDGTYQVTAEYNSPNQSIFGVKHTEPYYDDSYETGDQTALKERLKELITDEPEVSFTIEFADLRKAGYPYEQVNLGDSVFVIFEPLNVDISARILEIIDFPEEPKSPNVTLSNFRKNASDIMAQFGVTKNKVDKAIDEQGYVRFSVLDAAVKRATEYLNNSATELEYPRTGGILARDPNDPNKYVIYNSSGLGITTDGGQTFKEALTPDGLVASAGVVGQFTANNINVGQNLLLENNLITVLDNNSMTRAKLGLYTTGKYGLLLKSKDGNTTVLSEDGILQTDTIQEADNVDANNPLKLKVYIDDSTLGIEKVKLNFSLEPFRAYSKGAASGGGSTQTSSSGGGTTESTSSGGGATNWYGSNGGLSTSTTLQSYKSFIKNDGSHDHGGTTSTDGSHYHLLYDFYLTSPDHSHSVSIPSHSHDISIPNHSHGINYGIYTSTKATGVNIIVNGSTVDTTGYTTDQSNIDLTSYITTTGWHTIELTSTQLGRINASLFLKSFIGV